MLAQGWQHLSNSLCRGTGEDQGDETAEPEPSEELHFLI